MGVLCWSLEEPEGASTSPFSEGVFREMQQAKISAFFKPSSPKTLNPPQRSHLIESCGLSRMSDLKIPVTYKRRDPNPDPKSGDDGIQLDCREMGKINDKSANPSSRSDPVGKILNKKRSYAQYHLELGQSDFLLHSCSVCGLMYARGDEGDEKVHKEFHKNYYQGIQFKGWRNERVIPTSCSNADRIVLVLDGDPPAQKNKVRQIIKMMEKELGFSDDQLLHKLCKVYLFVSSHRIVGCLVAEPIRTAHRVISSTLSGENSDDNCASSVPRKIETADESLRGPNPTIQFGDFNFRREVIRKDSSNRVKVDSWYRGAILCEEEAVSALCGIRAIWVVQSSRRKRIASQLMDGARNTFCTDQVLEPSHCAFSPPTSAGRAFASSYCKNKAFLVYKVEDV